MSHLVRAAEIFLAAELGVLGGAALSFLVYLLVKDATSVAARAIRRWFRARPSRGRPS